MNTHTYTHTQTYLCTLAALADKDAVIRPQTREDKACAGVDEFDLLNMVFVNQDGRELLLGGDHHAVGGCFWCVCVCVCLCVFGSIMT